MSYGFVLARNDAVLATKPGGIVDNPTPFAKHVAQDWWSGFPPNDLLRKLMLNRMHRDGISQADYARWDLIPPEAFTAYDRPYLNSAWSIGGGTRDWTTEPGSLTVDWKVGGYGEGGGYDAIAREAKGGFFSGLQEVGVQLATMIRYMGNEIRAQQAVADEVITLLEGLVADEGSATTDDVLAAIGDIPDGTLGDFVNGMVKVEGGPNDGASIGQILEASTAEIDGDVVNTLARLVARDDAGNPKLLAEALAGNVYRDPEDEVLKHALIQLIGMPREDERK